MSQRLKKLANAGKHGSYRPNAPAQPDLAWDGEGSTAGDDDVGGVSLLDGLREFDWFAEYEELSAKFSWRIAAYIAWSSSPRVYRKPRTQVDLAQLLGLKSDRTIRKWVEDKPEILAEIKRLQASPLVAHRRDIYDALVKGALDVERGHQDRKLALELMGDYKAPRLPDGGQLALGFTADDAAAAEKEIAEFEQELEVDEQPPGAA